MNTLHDGMVKARACTLLSTFQLDLTNPFGYIIQTCSTGPIRVFFKIYVRCLSIIIFVYLSIFIYLIYLFIYLVV